MENSINIEVPRNTEVSINIEHLFKIELSIKI